MGRGRSGKSGYSYVQVAYTINESKAMLTVNVSGLIKTVTVEVQKSKVTTKKITGVPAKLALKKGTATITIKAGKKTKKVKVTVY